MLSRTLLRRVRKSAIFEPQNIEQRILNIEGITHPSAVLYSAVRHSIFITFLYVGTGQSPPEAFVLEHMNCTPDTLLYKAGSLPTQSLASKLSPVTAMSALASQTKTGAISSGVGSVSGSSWG